MTASNPLTPLSGGDNRAETHVEGPPILLTSFGGTTTEGQLTIRMHVNGTCEYRCSGIAVSRDDYMAMVAMSHANALHAIAAAFDPNEANSVSTELTGIREHLDGFGADDTSSFVYRLVEAIANR